MSTNTGGLSEVIGKNGEAGFSHNKDDAVGYADSIIKVLSDKEIKNKIVENALKRVNHLFNQENMIKQYYDKSNDV